MRQLSNSDRLKIGKMVRALVEEKQMTREQLADYAHKAWSGWMDYLFSNSVLNDEGTVTIPKDLVDRWKRQIDTDYADLSDKEQSSDLKEADKILDIVKKDNFN